MNFKQTSCEKAAREYQDARDEVHAAIAQATEVSEAEIRERMGALEKQAEKTWTCDRVALVSEMSGVAGDALENIEENC